LRVPTRRFNLSESFLFTDERNCFLSLGESLRRNKDSLIKVLTNEMENASGEAEATIEQSAHEGDWYAEH